MTAINSASSSFRRHAEMITVNALICISLFGYFDTRTVVALWIALTIANIFVRYREWVLIGFSAYILLNPTGLYKFIGYKIPELWFVAVCGVLSFYGLACLFVFKLSKWHFRILLLAGAVLVSAHTYAQNEALKTFWGTLVLAWAFNFVILLKEADAPKEDGPRRLFVSLNSFWNFPFFINLSYRFLSTHVVADDDSRRTLRKNSLIMILKATPLLFGYKYLLHILLFKSFYVEDIRTDMLWLNFNLRIALDLAKLGLFESVGANYAFGIIGSGFDFLVSLIYMNSSVVALLGAFGYRLPYRGFSLSGMKNTSGFLHQVYYFYNRSVIDLFHHRLVRLYQLVGFRKSARNKALMVFSLVLFGGLTINFVTDMTVAYFYFGGPAIFFNTLKSVPYFLAFSSLVVLGSSERIPNSKTWYGLALRIAIYVVAFSFVFSLGQSLLLRTDLDRFLAIMKSIFLGFLY